MNDTELRKNLEAWKLPEATETAKSLAQWHALTAYHNRQSQPSEAPNAQDKAPWRAWAIVEVAIAAICLAIVIFSGSSGKFLFRRQ